MSYEFDYVITLKKNNQHLLYWMSQLMLLLVGIAFLFEAVMGIQHGFATKSIIFWCIMFAIVAAWSVFCHLKRNSEQPPYFRLALMIAACGFFVIPGGKWLAFIYAITALIEKPVKMPLEIAFDGEGLVFNTFPKKSINWPLISNVVLKDGLLTIDLKSNKLMQREVDDYVNKQVEEEFNQFCQKQLKAQGPNSHPIQ